MQLSRTRFNQYVRSLGIASTLAQQELWVIWRALDVANADIVKNNLLDIMPGIVEKYGNVSALAATEYYNEVRSTAGQLTQYQAVMGKNVPREQVESSIRYAMRHAYEGNPQRTLEYLNGCVDKCVKQSARNTIAINANNDPAKPKFARVPTGAKTCAWCIMLASRGFVYSSVQSAGEMGQYHPFCDCQIVPGFGDTKLKGYDPSALYDMYYNARKSAGIGDTSAILSEMRSLYPDAVKDGEGALRTQDGALPLARELSAANKLTSKGYNVEFLPVSNIEGQKNPDAKIDGIISEIKSPLGSSKNTIDSNVRKAEKQSSRMVLDNSCSGLSDSQALEQLERSLQFRKGVEEVLFIEKSGIIWSIKNE